MSIGVWRALALLVLVGGAAWAIRRAGDRLRAEIGDAAGKKRAALTKDEIDAIVASGLATRPAILAMSVKEQRMLSVSVAALRAGQSPRNTRER